MTFSSFMVGRNYNGGRKTPVNREVAMKELLNVVRISRYDPNLHLKYFDDRPENCKVVGRWM